MYRLILAIFSLWLIVGTTSCINTRRLQYMQGAFDTTALSKVDVPPIVIQQNDLLSIVVYSDNPAATAIYNQSQVGAGAAASSGGNAAGGGSGMGLSFGAGGSNPSSGGYLVDQDGNIQFQGIGSLHVEGLTLAQLRLQLDSSLKKFLQKPYTTVRFLNYRVTIIGDVAHPGVFNIPSERVTLLEALGLAGDLNVTARRDNVLVVREQNGKRTYGRIDLTKPDIFKSSFFQLKQNDVVYVDLTKSKAVAADQATLRNITIATSVLTTIALIITVFRK